MKAKLNLTIDEDLLTGVKSYASNKKVSVSELVEIYFQTIVRPVNRKNIIDLVDQLTPPAIEANADLKKHITKDRGAGMASKIFLDANILLDFTLKRENYEPARSIIQMVASGQVQAHITPSIIQMTGYWLTKAYGPSKAKELLLILLGDIKVIEITHELAITALHSKIDDIEDALQYYTAIHNKIDVFISGDKILKQESIPILPVYAPDEFLQEFR